MITRTRDTSPSTTGVWSEEDCIDMTVVSIKGEIECGKTIDASEPKGLLGEPHASGILVVAGHKRVR